MLKKYEKYKDSGIEWIDKIPKDWNLTNIRRITVEHKQGFYSESGYVEDGLSLIRISDLNEYGNISNIQSPKVSLNEVERKIFLLKKDDFLFPRTGSIGLLGYVENLDNSVFASYLIRFRFSKITKPKYLKYFFISEIFKQGIYSNLHGGVNQNIHAEDIKNQYIILPPLPEQKAIVRFLDHKTTLIDKIISNRKRQIELLKEERKAVINQAVTKGINPDVKYKDSGIEWLGEIPEHWNVVKLKYKISIRSGEFLTNNLINETGDFKVYGGNGILGNCSSYNVNDETLVIGRVGAKCGNVHYINETAWISDNALIIKVKDSYKFYWYLFDIMELNQYSNQNAQPLITSSLLKELYVPKVSKDEQKTIVSYIDKKTGRVEKLINKFEMQIDLLEEYKTALISNAVTGQIDVRDWKPNEAIYDVNKGIDYKMVAEGEEPYDNKNSN